MPPGADAVAQARALLNTLRTLAAQHEQVLAAYERHLDVITSGGAAKLAKAPANKRPPPAPTEPEGPEAKKARLLAEQQAQRNTLWHECYKVLDRCRRNQRAEAFKKPVDPIKLKIPDYPTVVKNPMDLQTVGDKLKLRAYKEPGEFAADMRQIWDNAMLYNGRHHPIGANAVAMSEFFEKAWGPLQVEKHWAIQLQQEELALQVGRAGKGIAVLGKRWCLGGLAFVLAALVRPFSLRNAGARFAAASSLPLCVTHLASGDHRFPAKPSQTQALEGNADGLPNSDLSRQLKEKRDALGHFIAAHDFQEGLPPGTLGPCEPGRSMSFEEKRKLSAHLTSLPGEKMQRVVDIMEAGVPVRLSRGQGGTTACRASAAECPRPLSACPSSKSLAQPKPPPTLQTNAPASPPPTLLRTLSSSWTSTRCPTRCCGSSRSTWTRCWPPLLRRQKRAAPARALRPSLRPTRTRLAREARRKSLGQRRQAPLRWAGRRRLERPRWRLGARRH
jgi:hypothetical protein